MYFTFKDKKYKAKNTKKVEIAKDKVTKVMEELLKNEEDQEMFVMVLMSLNHYAQCGLEALDKDLGFNGVNKLMDLEEIKE